MGKWGLVRMTAVALVLFASAVHAKDLGDILLKKGLITEEELQQAREEEKQKAAAEESRRESILAKLPKWLDYITPFGDLRNRYEGFFQNHRVADNRFRLRARFGLTAAPSDEISATIRLATGNPDNPVSRNQTYQNVFTEKPISLDQAYMTFKPGKTFGIEPGLFVATAGKFSTNAFRTTEVMWDDDLTPEGFTETFNLFQEREGLLRGVRVNGFQWIVNQVSSGFDPWMGGGQVVADTVFGNTANLTAAFADYHFSNMNQVARQFLSPSSSNLNKQLAATNCLLLIRDGTGKVTKVNGFCTGFNILDGTYELDFPNILGIPAGTFGEIVYNTQAAHQNLGFYIGAGIGKSGKDYYHDTLKNQGDWAVSYTYYWVQRDATVALFNFDDSSYSQGTANTPNQAVGQTQTGSAQTGGTNVTGHIIKLDYMPITNFQLTWKVLLPNAIDAHLNQATSVIQWQGNPTLFRTQVDAMLKF
jgi:hypothetical protein